MGRPNSLGGTEVVSVRIETEMYQMLREIAALESINTGRTVTFQELVRNALKYSYSDNERLRECFRKSRAHITKRFK